MKQRYVYILLMALLLSCTSRNPSDGGPVTEEPHPDVSKFVGSWLVTDITGTVDPWPPRPDYTLVYDFVDNQTYTATEDGGVIHSGDFWIENASVDCGTLSAARVLRLENFATIIQYSFEDSDSLVFQLCGNSPVPINMSLAKQ